MHLVQLLYDTHSKHVDKHLTQLSFPALKKPLLHFLQFPLSQSSQFGLHVLFGSILALNFINEVSFILYLLVIWYLDKFDYLSFFMKKDSYESRKFYINQLLYLI